MALAVNTPDHLRGLGLLPDTNSSSVETVVVRGREVSRDDLGYLFHVALDKLTFLPFAYVMDQWRWSLFTGEVPDQEQALQELNRVLKPGGRLVVGELFPDPHFVTGETLRRRAERHGFQFVEQEESRFGYFARFHVPLYTTSGPCLDGHTR